MTTVKIEPGICGFTALVTAEALEDDEVRIRVESQCKAVRGMMEALGDTYDAFALCLARPGGNPMYRYAAEKFPGHASCPVIAGITKCAEAACGLALKRSASVEFID